MRVVYLAAIAALSLFDPSQTEIEAAIKLGLAKKDTRVSMQIPCYQVDITGPLSRITVSGNGRVVNSRSRIRHTRAPPLDTSTSITGTSFEQGSVIVKHLNRRPMTSRSWTTSIA